MKVTQVIKEAITTRVKAKCDEANLAYVTALSKEQVRLEKEKDAHKAELREKYKKLFMSTLDKLDAKKIEYSYTYYSGNECNTKEEIWERNIPSFSINVSSKYEKELKNKINENQEKAKKFINDIILELELGENKPTLESLLANVKF